MFKAKTVDAAIAQLTAVLSNLKQVGEVKRVEIERLRNETALAVSEHDRALRIARKLEEILN